MCVTIFPDQHFPSLWLKVKRGDMLYDLRILVLLKLFSGKKCPFILLSVHIILWAKHIFKVVFYFPFLKYFYSILSMHYIHVQLKVPPPVFISCEIRRSIILVDFLITSIKCNSRWQINLPSGNFVSKVHTTKKMILVIIKTTILDYIV